ncbi:DHHC palmitoyltransferase-like protein 5 [Elsinoe fawcettii]|nr:DHHC palmitoyltransferase-like protein 5 [Elsinoe fawcettii]
MATLGRDDSPSPSRRRRNGFAKRLERCCCSVFTYFPLFFVYGLTSWACYVGVDVGFEPGNHWASPATSLLIFVLYILLNASYTIAVFTPPGSPLNPPSTSRSSGAGYSSLPTHEPASSLPNFSTLTTKSTGRPRYCKKCQHPKPDRAHHCSTCGRCVLKMDHHCPWLATCVGLRNYKAFILFLTYTSLFCWVAFLAAAQWVYFEISASARMQNGSMTVNIILLSVLAGIIGLVLTGFTGWHVYLAASGMTTIECLEKTRYLSPVKRSMEAQLQRDRARGHDAEEQGQPLLEQLKEIHANALPGVTRPEEGEERNSNSSTPTVAGGQWQSPAQESLRRSYVEMEERRERDRYLNYLDEKDSEKLPHAFDLGWRRNLGHLLGEKWWLWPLPVCNTTGDGWRWEVSENWMRQRDEVARAREARQSQAEHNWREGQTNGFGMGGVGTMGSGRHFAAPTPQRSLQMQNLRRDEVDDYDTSSDEDRRTPRPAGHGSRAPPAGNWNDVPEEYTRRPDSGSRRKGD